jgi:hypothetical protein
MKLVLMDAMGFTEKGSIQSNKETNAFGKKTSSEKNTNKCYNEKKLDSRTIYMDQLASLC